MPTTRLAPSPTGALHLGNARTFLVTWALARQNSWRVVLRIDDLDGPRIKAGAASDAIETLRWLGLDWDEGPHYQTHDTAPYREALRHLVEHGDAYPCRCTRAQMLAASLSAPHAGEHELRYPGTCRGLLGRGAIASAADFASPEVAWRLVTPDAAIEFVDELAGRQSFNPQQEVGDFLVATKGGAPSYQLATVVDDARQGIDCVVRGDDLLASTARQMLLYDRLKATPGPQRPRYWHMPLVVGEDGRRLAKRHGDSRIDSYRALGIGPERIIGLVAEWCGLGPRRPMNAADFCDGFRLDAIPRQQVVFAPADDAWLRAL
ncbi:MAG: glutamate--tRNA ligase family protein [Lacipirellulaceae bacterium]